MAGYSCHMASPSEVQETLSLLRLRAKRVRSRVSARVSRAPARAPAAIEPGDTGWVTLSRQGVPADALGELATALGLANAAELAAELGLAERTLHRRLQKKQMLPFDEAEKSVRVARALVKARRVFEDDDSARRWLLTPSKALGGARPLSLLESADGFTLVMDELGRIDYGVYS